jgi:putative hemolysin
VIPFLIVLAVIGSALFAGLETGVVSLNRIRLRVRARRGDAQASRMLRMLQRPERVLSTFLVGNTVCNVGGGALASFWAVQGLRLGETAGSLAATVGMTAIFLVFSELGPKAYFRVRAEDAVPRFFWFIRGVTFVLAPIEWISSALLRLLVGRSGKSAFVSREELRQLVREARERLGTGQQRMLESIFDFGHTVAREVMIPLPDVVSLPESASVEELFELVRLRRYTRIPLYRNRVDQIVGLVNVFDVLYDRKPAPRVAAYRRDIHVVPETSLVHRVLVELQHRRETMALVVNEFGALIGIVTVEDIVEEIMGELADEHEELTHPIQKVGDGYVVDATLDIDDLNEELGLALAKDRFDTVGGLVLRRLGRIPGVGERVKVGNLEIEVLAVHPYGLKRVKIRLLEGGLGER